MFWTGQDPAYAGELAKWRGRMVRQFETEGRGDSWVKAGVLQLRQTQTYGPNYPGHHGGGGGGGAPATCTNVSLAPGDKLNLEPNAVRGLGVDSALRCPVLCVVRGSILRRHASLFVWRC